LTIRKESPVRRRYFALVLLLAALLTACGPRSSAKSGTFHFAVRGSPNIKDLPFLQAIDLLRGQGYDVEVTSLSKGELIAQAIEQGDVHIANVSPSILWVAVTKGADIRTVVGNYDNTFYLVVGKQVQHCSDLDGLSLAFSSKLAAGYVLFEKFIAENCPGTTPQIVLIGQSENRVVALQSGEIDGAYLEMEQWLALESMNPGEFRIILNYGQEYPDYLVSGFCARRSWAEENPEMVEDFARALVTSQRQMMADPSHLQAEVAELLELDDIEARRMAEAYLAQGVWEANGALEEDKITYTLGILAEYGAVPPDTTVEDVADLTYLATVLDEIGRE
jgi:ABC-type nitrate/sulfonate/bicarbonate transport system substrate-binding protein